LLAIQPEKTLSQWLGTGAVIAATNTTLGSHYVIPKAAIQAYVGNDAVITDDIRDFLFSVLSRLSDVYNEPLQTGNTRVADVVVSRSVNPSSGTASFTVTLRDNTYTPPYLTLLGTYS
jgi:hypothetical protein